MPASSSTSGCSTRGVVEPLVTASGWTPFSLHLNLRVYVGVSALSDPLVRPCRPTRFGQAGVGRTRQTHTHLLSARSDRPLAFLPGYSWVILGRGACSTERHSVRRKTTTVRPRGARGGFATKTPAFDVRSLPQRLQRGKNVALAGARGVQRRRRGVGRGEAGNAADRRARRAGLRCGGPARPQAGVKAPLARVPLARPCAVPTPPRRHAFHPRRLPAQGPRCCQPTPVISGGGAPRT